MKPDTTSDTTRRGFLRHTGALAAGAAALSAGGGARADDAADKSPAAEKPSVDGGKEKGQEKLVFGIIGPGGQGINLLNSFVRQPDVEIAYVCDVDEHHTADAVNQVREVTGKTPKATKDLRQVLDDKAVHAVIIATPDHWHAPATILACDAGKHVYVEKPASHNIREGRLMVEAARRNGRVVQLGTQSRSVEHNIKAMKMLKDGIIGEVLVAKAWNSQRRGDIGKQQPGEPPAWLDYDAWLGPAPKVPFQSNRLHGVWRWWYDFGTGDIGNDGVHDIDVARWGLGVETHPTTIAAGGGKYFFDNDQEFPDTQYVTFEYAPAEGGNGNGGKKKMLVYEQRLWSPYVQEGQENGCAYYGTGGMMVGGKKAGWQIFGPRNEPREKIDSTWGDLNQPDHHRDFLDCIKTSGTPHAEIEIGHLSSTLSHLGNIATRVGRVIHFDPKTEQIVGDDEANALVTRKYRDGHWAVPKNA